MTKTRDLANLVSGSNPLVDGVIDYSEITNTPAPFDPDTLAAVAVSGAYADLGGKPALATVATSGSFNDLSNQPTPFDPATLASVATTGAYSSLSGTPALATVATTGAYGNLTGTPALAAVATSGAYSSLSGTPALAAVATTGAYSSLSGTPALAAVATSGAYSSLSGKPNGVGLNFNTVSNTGTFTKPNDGNTVTANWNKTGLYSGSQYIVMSRTLTAEHTGNVTISNGSFNAGNFGPYPGYSYQGEIITFLHYDASLNQTAILGTWGKWNQNSETYSSSSAANHTLTLGLNVYGINDRFMIICHDVYTGAFYNSLAQINAGTCFISLGSLALT